MEDDRRQFSRLESLEVHVRFEAEGGRAVESKGHQISANGLFVLTDESPAVGTRGEIEMDFNGLRMWAKMEVARVTDEGFGVRFSEVDLASFEHLRNLIVFNSTDPERAKLEFDSHVGLLRPR